MSMYKQFKTDPKLETDGIWLLYGIPDNPEKGDFSVKVARDGINNKAYVRRADKILKPMRRQVDNRSIDPKLLQHATIKLYAETIIKDWQVYDGKEWKQGIEGENSKKFEIIDFNVANVEKTLQNLPDLFDDISDQVRDKTNFQKDELERDAKN